ncbi:MAG: hypothetical protein HFF73_01105 [Oscillospiraceae bacterium]|nr:hypothetical protein [Oscillospiraceae bacterium]
MRKKKTGNGISFDFSSLTFGQAIEEDREEIPKLSTEPAAFENAEQMADSLDYSKDYFVFVPGNFIFGDFLEALCYKKRLAPDEIYITTLGMSQDNVDSIVNLTDYLGCKKVNLIVSHYFAGVERHKLIPYMQREFAGKQIDVAVLQSHCKIALIFSSKGNILISGSANLSSSNNVEQFVIMHDEKTITYVKKRLDNIMRRFTVYSGIGNKSNAVDHKANTGKRAFETLMEG